MLYIFDLGNVIVDIDFNRVLGAWSDLTRVPLATLKKSFHMGEAFHQHERGEISDEAFAEALCCLLYTSLFQYRYASEHRPESDHNERNRSLLTIRHQYRDQDLDN